MSAVVLTPDSRPPTPRIAHHMAQVAHANRGKPHRPAAAAPARLVLYCKGADTMIFERLAKTEQQERLRETLDEHLEVRLDPSPRTVSARARIPHGSAALLRCACLLRDGQHFARTGLRTLCLARRELSDDEYRVWLKHYKKASRSLHNRAKKMEAVAELIERDMELLGITAIEDKLQDGVPETLVLLARVRACGPAGMGGGASGGRETGSACSHRPAPRKRRRCAASGGHQAVGAHRRQAGDGDQHWARGAPAGDQHGDHDAQLRRGRPWPADPAGDRGQVQAQRACRGARGDWAHADEPASAC